MGDDDRLDEILEKLEAIRAPLAVHVETSQDLVEVLGDTFIDTVKEESAKTRGLLEALIKKQ